MPVGTTTSKEKTTYVIELPIALHPSFDPKIVL